MKTAVLGPCRVCGGRGQEGCLRDERKPARSQQWKGGSTEWYFQTVEHAQELGPVLSLEGLQGGVWMILSFPASDLGDSLLSG